MGAKMDWTLPSFHGGSFKNTLTDPFNVKIIKFINSGFLKNAWNWEIKPTGSTKFDGK